MGRRTRNMIYWALGLFAAYAGAQSAVAEESHHAAVFGVYVPPIVRWVGFPQDATATFQLTHDEIASGRNRMSKVFRLALNVDATITAHTTPFTNPADSADTLNTRWRIVDDADGDSTKTGVRREHADASQGYGQFVENDAFLRRGVLVTHRSGDGNAAFIITAHGERDGIATSEDRNSTVVYEATLTMTAIPNAASVPRGREAQRTTVR